jgi:hypothetical protein
MKRNRKSSDVTGMSNSEEISRMYFEASQSRENYGFRFFDKPTDYGEDEEEREGFDEKSCSPSCCDPDCECDDCMRCSEAVEPDSFYGQAAAA